MRNIVFSLLLIAAVTFLTGCDSSSPKFGNSAGHNVKLVHSDYFDVHVVEEIGDCCLVIEDRTTRVLYLVLGGYNSCAITPIYNEDGTLKLCNEEKCHGYD